MPADDTTPRYDIRFDPAQRILFIELHGFWTIATVAAFTARVLAAATAAKLRHGAFGVLTDMSGFPVQSREVAGAFAAFTKATGLMNGGRVATLSSTALVRMQVQRETPVEGTRFFTDREEAIAWLKEGDTRT